MKFTKRFRLALVAALACVAGTAQALPIYVINQGVSSHGMVINAINYLNGLGHAVTTGSTLGDYSSYTQVWDLRYNANLGAGDVTAMGSFLAGGGRMYLTGEHSGFNGNRNNSLVSWVSNVGGGSMTLTGSSASSQQFTAAAQAVGLDSAPNALGGLSFSAAQGISAGSITQGFLATSDGGNGTNGGLVGWDFGDISGAANARMLIGFDIELFHPDNGSNWAENIVTFLGGTAPPAVPEPGSLALFGLALGGALRRRKRAR